MNSKGDININKIIPKLPDFWKSFSFKDAIKQISISKKLKKDEIFEIGEFPIIDQGEKFITGYTNNSDYVINCELPVIIFGDHTRRFKYIDFKFAIGADGTKILSPIKKLNPKFLYNYFCALEMPDFGYSRHFKILSEIPIPLPPLPEQERIVARLDSLLEKHRSINQSMERIPQILKQFRQSVLTQAVTGKLTEDWREENGDIERAEELLKRIQLQRIKQYNELCRIAKMEGKNKPTKRYIDVIPKIAIDGVKLPENWTISNIDYLAWVTKLAGFEYTQYIKFAESGDVPVVRAQNVHMGKFIEDNLVYIDKETSDFLERSRLFGNEVLIVFIGAGTGNVCMCPTNKRWHLAPNVAKIVPDEISSKYLNYFLQSNIGFKYMSSFIKATAQPSLSMETIRQIVVYLPPLAEQTEIVRRVEKLFAVADSIEKQYQNLKSQTDMLPEAILKKAFEGGL